MERHLCHTTPAGSASSPLRPLVSAALMRLHYEHGGQRLMQAVLLDAVGAIEGHSMGDRAKSWSECQATVQWVQARGESWPFSFENICAALGLNADKLRTTLSAEFPAPFFRASHASTFRPKALATLPPAQGSLRSP